MKIIKVDPNKIVEFKEEAGKLFFKKEAEEQLIKLIKLKEMVDQAVDDVKAQIKEAGKKVLGVEFKGIIGDRVKVINRFYGQKYELIDEVSARDFVEEIVYKKIKVKEVDEYFKNTGETPEGIAFKDRDQTLSIIVEKK